MKRNTLSHFYYFCVHKEWEWCRSTPRSYVIAIAFVLVLVLCLKSIHFAHAHHVFDCNTSYLVLLHIPVEFFCVFVSCFMAYYSIQDERAHFFCLFVRRHRHYSSSLHVSYRRSLTTALFSFLSSDQLLFVFIVSRNKICYLFSLFVYVCFLLLRFLLWWKGKKWKSWTTQIRDLQRMEKQHQVNNLNLT